jgi:hypothetical protein
MAGRSERDVGKERFWRQVVEQWRRSGQKVRAFCAAHDLSEASFYGWRRTIDQRDEAAAKPNFVPVRVMVSTKAPAPAPLEIVLERGGAGRVLRVPAGFDAATLRQLLAVLEEPSC